MNNLKQQYDNTVTKKKCHLHRGTAETGISIISEHRVMQLKYSITWMKAEEPFSLMRPDNVNRVLWHVIACRLKVLMFTQSVSFDVTHIYANRPSILNRKDKLYISMEGLLYWPLEPQPQGLFIGDHYSQTKRTMQT